MHQELELHSPLAAVAEGRASLGEYRHSLEMLHGFITPLEAGIRCCLASIQDREAIPPSIASNAWQRGHLLESDLLALGRTRENIKALPQCRDFPAVTTLEQVLGQLYVFEGSRLGGKVMAVSIRSSLGLGGDNGCAYFSSEGRDVAPMWKQFKAILDHDVPPESEFAVISAARDCFLAMGEWFDSQSRRGK